MTNLPDLHDGFFDGLWLSEDKRARLFVRTETGQRYTIILTEVEALNVKGLRAGNIIFDVVLIAPAKLTVTDIEWLYDLTDDQKKWHVDSLAKRSSKAFLHSQSTHRMEPKERCSFGLSTPSQRTF